MSDTRGQSAAIKPWQRICEVLHPFDPNEENRVAFAHALRFALSARARLSLMSLCPPVETPGRGRDDEPWATLARWNGDQLSTGAPKAELNVRHLQVTGDKPVKACVRYLKDNLTDLVVLATHVRRGKMSWLGKSTAEVLAGRTGEMTLLLPDGAKGFVSGDDGTIKLDRILVAVTREPSPEPAIEAARRLMLSVPGHEGVASLVHVGAPAQMPALRLPKTPGWSWTTVCKPGEVVETILTIAAETRAGLIVMTTAGHHGFLGAIRGTVSEHVLREAGCPLLTMPVGSLLG